MSARTAALIQIHKAANARADAIRAKVGDKPFADDGERAEYLAAMEDLRQASDLTAEYFKHHALAGPTKRMLAARPSAFST